MFNEPIQNNDINKHNAFHANGENGLDVTLVVPEIGQSSIVCNNGRYRFLTLILLCLVLGSELAVVLVVGVACAEISFLYCYRRHDAIPWLFEGV